MRGRILSVTMTMGLLCGNLLNLQGGPKIGTIILYPLTLANINRLSKLFHCQNQEKICNNTITKNPTAPQVCRSTNL